MLNIEGDGDKRSIGNKWRDVDNPKAMQIKRIHFDSIGSTNTWAKEHVEELDSDCLTIITADEQTAGRGRFTRDWVSPKGCNLYVTYVVFVKDLRFSIGNLPQVLALAALEAHVSVGIKWPNDLVIGKKKLGGILCEVVQCDFGYAVVVGLGLNINMPKSYFDKIDRPATSLLEELGSVQDREHISERIHKQFILYLTLFLEKGFTPLLDSFRKAIVHQTGEIIRFSNFQTVIEGAFQRIDDKGALVLIVDGKEKTFTSGELL